MTIPFLAVGIGDTTVAFLAVGPSIESDGGGGGGGGVGMIIPFLSVGTGDATVVYLPIGPSGSADGGDGGDGEDVIVITGTTGPGYRRNGTDVVNHTWNWVSDADGNATIVSGLPVSGEIERVDFIPSASVAPSADYDVTLTDENGIDVLSEQGTDLSDTTKLTVIPGTPLTDGTTVGVVSTVVDGLLTLNVSNAGDSKAGRVVVYVR